MTETPSTAPSHAERLPGLDTLRACAILMVIPFHAWGLLHWPFLGPTVKNVVKHGWAGVDLFFVLSGFLIGGQLLQGVQRDGRVRFRRFYAKRSLRILPSYYAVLLLYYVWPAFREKPAIDAPWKYLLFVMNYGRHGEAYSHAWSLCVEEHFYLVVPALVALWAWRPRWFKPGLVFAGVMALQALMRTYLWSVDAGFFLQAYRKSHFHLDSLAVGVGLAYVRVHRESMWNKLTARPWLATGIGVVLVGVGMAMYQTLDLGTSYALCFTLMAFGFGALLVAAMAPGFWLATWRIPGAAAVATGAFTLYLTHKQMIHLAMTLVGDDSKQHPAATIALSVLLVVGCSAVLHFLVERPGLALRDRLLKFKVFAGNADKEACSRAAPLRP